MVVSKIGGIFCIFLVFCLIDPIRLKVMFDFDDPRFASDSAPLSTDYLRNTILDDATDSRFRMYWTFDEKTITFEVHARSKGWASIGFSTNGGMAGSDMVVFAFDAAGKPFLSDRHGPLTENGFPPEDKVQDYTLLGAKKNETHLIFTFSRKLDTCDDEDMAITNGTTKIIFSTNEAVPEDRNNFAISTYQGSRSIYLLQKVAAERKTETQLLSEGATSTDFLFKDVAIPSDKYTLSWCRIYALPTNGIKEHIIRVQAIVQKENTDLVHHMILFACGFDVAHLAGSNGDLCFEGANAAIFAACAQHYLTVWSLGAEPRDYPDNVGMPFFGNNTFQFVMLQIHYKNPEFLKGQIDNSGLRLWTTKKLRPIESGEMTIGVPAVPSGHMIPPRVPSFTTYAYCSSKCTSDLPKEGVKVFGGFLHAHLFGRKIHLLHFRHGKQLPNILGEENYDFFYQGYHIKNEPTVVLPGDEIVAECVYETLNRNTTIFGGYTFTTEMCLVHLDYYPMHYGSFLCLRTDEKVQLLATVGIDPRKSGVSNVNEYPSKPALNDFLSKTPFDWSGDHVQRFQDVHKNGQHISVCIKQNVTRSENNPLVILTGQNIKLYDENGYPIVKEPLPPNVDCVKKVGRF